MSSTGSCFDELDHIVVMDPLSNFSVPENMDKRTDELYANGFREIVFVVLRDTVDAESKNLERLGE